MSSMGGVTDPGVPGHEPVVAPRPAPRDERDERFVVLFRTHWAAVHAYARRRTSGDADAHDVAAETFTVAWRRLADIPEDHALPWLYRTAANVLANQTRSSRRRERLRNHAADQPHPHRPLLDEAVVADESLRTAFAALPDGERELLLLVAWEGLTNDEIATVLGVTTNAAALRVSRARAHFEDALLTADADAGHGRDERPGPREEATR